MSKSKGAVRYAEIVFGWQKLWLALIAAATVFFGAGLLKLRIDNSIEALLQQGSETLQAFQVFTETFGNSELAVVAIKEENGIFRPEVLERIAAITAKIESDVRHNSGVVSLTNIQIVDAVDGNLAVRPLLDMSAGAPTDVAALQAALERAKVEPYIKRTLISDDGKTTAILVRSIYPQTDKEKQTFRQELARDLFAVLKEFDTREDYFHIGGPPVFLTYFDEYILKDLVTFTPLVMLVLCALLILTFRSPSAVWLPLSMVGMAGIWTMGFMGWMDFPITLATTIIPPLLAVTGIEDSIYVYSFFQDQARQTSDKFKRAFNTSVQTAAACALTSVTTAIGFGALAITDINAVFETGVVSAVGTMFMWVMNNVLMVIILQRVNPPKAVETGEDKQGLMSRMLQGIATVNLKHTKKVFVFGILFMCCFLPGIAMLKVETNFIKYFDEQSPIRQAHDFFEHNLSGVAPMEILVDTGQEGGIKNPAVLAEMAAIKADLATDPTIDWIFGTSDFVEILHKNMTAAAATDVTTAAALAPQQSFPVTEATLVAQYFLLYQMAGGGAGLEDFMSDDGQYGRISARLKDASTGILEETINHGRRLFAAADSGAKYTFADNTAMLVGIVDSMLLNTLTSLMLASAAIWLLMSLFLRSFKFALIFMVPNMIPILLVLGMMGYVGVELNLSTMMIGSIAIGLAVDNTIHIFAHFPKAIAHTAGDIEKATRETIGTVGRASISAAIALCGGFLVLTLSEFYPNFWFGTLSAFTLIVALVSDLTITYTIWIMLGRAGYKGSETFR